MEKGQDVSAPQPWCKPHVPNVGTVSCMTIGQHAERQSRISRINLFIRSPRIPGWMK